MAKKIIRIPITLNFDIAGKIIGEIKIKEEYAQLLCSPSFGLKQGYIDSPKKELVSISLCSIPIIKNP